MLTMALRLAAILVPVQIAFGHLAGEYVHDKQPTKFAAIEGPLGRPAACSRSSHRVAGRKGRDQPLRDFPYLLGQHHRFDGPVIKERGLKSFPADQRPPVLIPFFAFQIMVGCGLLMLGLAWLGTWLSLSERILRTRLFLWATFLSFPLGFIATLTGWFTAEVGRQPWVVFGQLRTADAVTPFLTSTQVATSLTAFATIYSLIFAFGVYYIYRLLRAGPLPAPDLTSHETNPKRPAVYSRIKSRRTPALWRANNEPSRLLGVRPGALDPALRASDGFDLGVGMLFPFAPGEKRTPANAGRHFARVGRATKPGS